MRTMRKGQSYAEYIIAVFLFIGILIFLFSSLFVRTQQESTAIDEQSNCAKAEAIADALLKSCGDPTNWDVVGTVKTIGLTNCTNYIVPQTKWEKAKKTLGINTTYIGLPIGNASWRISYEGYAFGRQNDNASFLCNSALVSNRIGAVICRSSPTISNTIHISVNSTSPGTAYLLFYFPNISTGITMLAADANIESNDQAGISATDNGTLVELILQTDKNDRDTPKIFTSAGGGFAKTFTYLDSYHFESRTNKDLPIYLANTSFKDSIGPKPVNPSGLCKVQRGGEIRVQHSATFRDGFPVRFIVEVWS